MINIVVRIRIGTSDKDQDYNKDLKLASES